MSHNSSVGSPAVLFVEGTLSVRGFQGSETSVLPSVLLGSSAVFHLPGMLVSKVCYFRHCSWVDEIDEGLGTWLGVSIPWALGIWFRKALDYQGLFDVELHLFTRYAWGSAAKTMTSSVTEGRENFYSRRR
jgi:hypothetical protein